MNYRSNKFKRKKGKMFSYISKVQLNKTMFDWVGRFRSSQMWIFLATKIWICHLCHFIQQIMSERMFNSPLIRNGSFHTLLNCKPRGKMLNFSKFQSILFSMNPVLNGSKHKLNKTSDSCIFQWEYKIECVGDNSFFKKNYCKLYY